MKKKMISTAWKVHLVRWAASVVLSALPLRADLEVSGGVRIQATAAVYAPLAAEGTWVEVGGYGRCWHPTGVAVEWRPYCYGHWVWTDCGWYWASDEPWGWACYHYGTWVDDPGFGWVWVPGIEWAPAWVSWRVGGGYIGWAPLPPPRVTLVEPQFVFVQSGRFTDPVRPAAVIVNNSGIYAKTTVVNNVKRETRTLGGGIHEKVVVNEGPGLASLDKATARRLHQVPIQQAARQAAAPAGVASHAGAGSAKGGPGVSPPEPGRPGLVPGTSPVPPHEGPPHPEHPGKGPNGGEGKGHGEHGQEGKGHGKDEA